MVPGAALGVALLLIASTVCHGIGANELLGLLSPTSAGRERGQADAAPTGTLPVLYLDLDRGGYRALGRQREEMPAPVAGQPEESGWIAASARFGGKSVPIQLRLATDVDDRRTEDKWPLEVKVRQGGTDEKGTEIGGMRLFTARSPAARGYLSGWVYGEELRRRDILAPRSRFVQLWVGGRDWGVYVLEEALSSRLLASMGREKGVIVGLDSALVWQQDGAGRPLGDERMPGPIDVLNAGDVEPDPLLREQRDAAVAMLRAFQLGELSVGQVFDVERVGVYAAHANLWGAWAGSPGSRAWFYYNPLTARLEPMAYGTWPGTAAGAPLAGLGWYQDMEAMTAYVAEAVQILQPEYLDHLRADYAAAFEGAYVDLAQEFASTALEAPWSMLVARQPLLAASLHPSQTVHAYRVTGEVKGAIDLRLANLLPYPVVLRGLQTGGAAAGMVEIGMGWVLQSRDAHSGFGLVLSEAAPSVVLQGAVDGVPRYVVLRVPAAALRRPEAQDASEEAGQMQLVTQVAGSDVTVVVDVLGKEGLLLPEGGFSQPPSLDEALARYPFLQLADRPGYVELRPGAWQVDGDLVLPDGVGLVASGPVTLAFDRDAALISSGPLLLQGTPEGPVRLLPKAASWGGILVFRAAPGTVSLLEQVEIQGVEGVQRSSWQNSGGVTFYESSALMRQCTVRDAAALQTVWVVGSDVEVWDTSFEELGGDALAIDQGQGRVERSTFRDIRGNAVAATGSRLDVRDVTFSRIYGFGLSAGQGSDVVAADVRATDLFAALLSLDRSSVQAYGVHLARNWAAGFVAHQKAMAPGPGEVRAFDVTFEDDSVPALVQEGSQVTINGEVFGLRKLDVTELYRQRDFLAAMHALEYRFGTQIALAGYDLPTPQIRPGGAMSLTLYWYALAEMGQDYTVFVHVLDDAGQQVAGWDNMPCQDGCPTSGWRPGRLVSDAHVVPLPEELATKEVVVAVGLYHLSTGERLPVRGPEGVDLANATLLLDQRLQVVP